MLAKATQLCNAKLGIMWSYDGEAFTIAAERGTPPPSTVFGDTLARPGPTTALGRVQREKRVLHIPDMMDEEAYRTATRCESPRWTRSGFAAGSASRC